jgi:hypothetical protein
MKIINNIYFYRLIVNLKNPCFHYLKNFKYSSWMVKDY